MGLLVDGQPLPPEDLKIVQAYIRQHGIQQFINTWRRLKNVQNDELKFGDEIECGIFAVDAEKRTAKLSIRGAEVKSSISKIKPSFSLHFLCMIRRFGLNCRREKRTIATKPRAVHGIQNTVHGWWNLLQADLTQAMLQIYFESNGIW